MKYILKIKLKSILKKIELELNDLNIILKFFSDLDKDLDYIKIGPIAFKKDELKYAIYIEKRR